MVSRCADLQRTWNSWTRGPPLLRLFAPRGTPSAAVDRFAAALAKVLSAPSVRDRISAMGCLPEFMDQSQFGDRVRTYTAQWAQTIKASGYQPQ
nr:tripartite tricarboxylate transporter substrate-binding protein [Pseudacidovorax sp. RU35E]